MKLLLSGCAMAALLAGVASRAEAQVETQVAVAPAPIHAIPASDAQPGPLINGPAQKPAITAPVAPPPPAAPVAQLAPELPAATPMRVADASPVRLASSETSLIASLAQPPPVQPAVLTEDEAAFFNVLGKRVTDAATAYDGYVRQAAAIDPGFNDAAAVQRAVTAGAAYQPEQLQQGIVAYAAMLALRSPAFVAGVRAQAQADPNFADQITEQPVAVLQVPGAAQAAMDVAGVLRAHGVVLQTTGRAIGKAAYDMQAQPWSRQPVADPVEVLAGVKASSAQPRQADAPSEKLLLQSLVSAPRLEAYGPPTATPAVVRGMAVAALAIMGRAGDKEDLRIATLLRDALAADCLKLAMLNMNQCLAAAGPHYDDVFCVGEHAVGETARCVSGAADGGVGAPDPNQRMAAIEAPAVQAPAAAQPYGPEQAAAYGYAPRPIAPEDEAPAAPPTAQLAADRGYPEGDGTFNGQIYARRAQAQQPQPNPQQAAAYAYQDAPPQPAPQPAYGYGYGYGAPAGGYYASAPDYYSRGYAPR